MRYTAPSLIALALLTGCGGDSSPTPTPTPVPTPTPTPSVPNGPPSFTSAASVSVAENTSMVYQATATDPDNNPLAFTISGGPDAARFTIDGTGKLSFVAAPDFEQPADADGNNVYLVTLRVSDGTASATLDLQVTVTNSSENIAVHRVGSGFSQPVQIFPTPNNNDEIYVIEKGGRIYRLNVTTGAKTLELTVANLSTTNERGLIGITTGPRTAGGGLAAYVVATAADGTVELRQYGLNATTGTFETPATPNILLSIPHSAANHNGGWIEFGPDGLLYMAVGDNGVGDNAQDTTVRLGKILRLGLSSTGWGPAPGNPFLSGGGDPYIFALGLRNPFRNAFEGNNLIIADVGEGNVEEVDIIPITQAGTNFGWPFKEGTRNNRGTAPPGLTGPVLQYTHGNGPLQGGSITGGRVYHGPIASLEGQYFFGDYVSRHVWSVSYERMLAGPLLDGAGYQLRDADLTADVGAISQPVAFNTDKLGRFYIVDLDGEIFRIDPG